MIAALAWDWCVRDEQLVLHLQQSTPRSEAGGARAHQGERSAFDAHASDSETAWTALLTPGVKCACTWEMCAVIIPGAVQLAALWHGWAQLGLVGSFDACSRGLDTPSGRISTGAHGSVHIVLEVFEYHFCMRQRAAAPFAVTARRRKCQASIQRMHETS